MKVRTKKKAKKQGESVEILANKLISELVEKHSFEVHGEREHINIWIFEDEIQIEQMPKSGGLNTIKFKRKEVIK